MPAGHFEPYQTTVGTIIGAFQGTNCYQVITDFGRYRAWYFALSTGSGGVRHGGGLAPGSQVLVCFGPGEQEAWILQVLQVPWKAGDAEPHQLVCFPQVSGFESGTGFVGKLYADGKGGLANRPSDVLNDLVNGEWGLASPNGSGLGVELFRAFLRGGAMSGLWCWADTQLTRLAGLDFEFMTLAQSDYDRRQGNSIVRSRSRVLYPSEALSDHLPRDMEVYGAIHGGDHRFLGPQASRNDASRQALLHELRGTDGSYVVSSASLVHLQRYVAMPMPEETVATAIDSTVQATQILDPPLDADETRNKVLTTPRQTVATAQTTSLGWLQHALDVVQAIIDKGNGGFDRLGVQWAPRTPPTEAYFGTYGKEMWRNLPQTRTIAVDVSEGAKKVYVGRSSFTLMPDGSIVLEDAWHSQIIMSGGNIVLSAAHDIVLQPGRNLVGIAGNVASLRAEKHIDLSANSGRVSIKAEEQLALLGGNGGNGGVLIESKGVNQETTTGTGLAQVVGGVVVKSASGLWADASEIGLNARDADVTLRAVGLVSILSPQLICKVTEVSVYFDPTAAVPAYVLDHDRMLVPGVLVVAGQIRGEALFVDGQALVTGSVLSAGNATLKDTELRAAAKPIRADSKTFSDAVVKNVKAIDKREADFLKLKTPLNGDVSSALGFTFPTSKQLHTNTALAFVLPELRWQAVARRAGKGSYRVWTDNPVKSLAGDNQPTTAFPGYENWAQGKTYRLNSVDLCFDLKTGLPKTPTEAAITITDEELVNLDQNFAIGDDV